MKRIYWFVFPVFLVLLLPHPVSTAAPREVKRVLILHSERKDNPGQELTEQGIREVLLENQHYDIKVFIEYLDVSRFGTPAHATAISDCLRRKYSGMEINAIITVYPWAVDFLLAEKGSLFSKVPVIAAADSINAVQGGKPVVRSPR